MAKVPYEEVEELGEGSYGKVCRVKYDKRNYAAKTLRGFRIDMHDPKLAGHREKFNVEWKHLVSLRHECIVKYIDMFVHNDTLLPVLIMELCGENLTKFLERCPSKPLPYHTEVNIGLDIARALEYLHGKGIIHQDLSSNNVLMVGNRVKVSDFGMSTLQSVNPNCSSNMFPVPHNAQYLSPQALSNPPTHTEKVDVFSFGVILMQILTKKAPNPTDRFRQIPDQTGTFREVPETERRSTHLCIIAEIHPLKPIIHKCLKNKEEDRPTATEVVCNLKCLRGEDEFTRSYERELHHCRKQKELEQTEPAADEAGLKLIVVGQSGVGKTCLVKVFEGEDFRAFKLTLGCDVVHKNILYEGKLIKLNIWDSAGLKRFQALSTAFFRGAQGALVCFDVTDAESYQMASKWIEATRLNIENVEIVLAGNKTDLVRRRKVTEEDGRNLAHKHNIPFIETSACKNENIEMAFTILVENIMKKREKPPERDVNTIKLKRQQKPSEVVPKKKSRRRC